MIDLTYDISTDTVKLVRPATIKVGADVPVRLTFSAAPGEVSSIQLALGSDTAAPVTLAFSEDFSSENATTWTALLDADDSRLRTHVSGKGATTVNIELVTIIDGERQVSPNIPIIVQPRIITGPDTGAGGPSYLTEAQSDDRYLPKSGIAAIANGASEVTVAFSTEFTSAPIVFAIVAKASVLDPDVFVVTLHSVSELQFKAVLSGATPNANYTLHWIARN